MDGFDNELGSLSASFIQGDGHSTWNEDYTADTKRHGTIW